MFLTHRPVRILLVLAAVVMLGGACAQVEPPQQSLDTEEFKQKISEYLTRLNKKLDRVQVEEVKRHEESSLVSVYHSILREIGFKKNLSSRVVRTECARRNGWAGPGFGKKLSWSRENEVWLALSVREE